MASSFEKSSLGTSYFILTNSSNRPAPPVPDLLEADFVEAEPDAAPAQLTSEDAATKKAMIAALEKFSDYENLKARLSGGQQEALEDIVQMTAYFCRRNVKGKDDGMIEGKCRKARAACLP